MSEKLLYSMGEVAEMFDVKASLIHFWETKFDILRPERNKKGNRLFTPADIENLKLIYHLVKEQGMTLEGARRTLKQAKKGSTLSRDTQLLERLQRVRSLLEEVRAELRDGGEVPVEQVSEQARPALEKAERTGAPVQVIEAGPRAETEKPAPKCESTPKPRRKKEDEKELFAFFEQSLFD